MKDEVDFRQYHELESYLLDTVRSRFSKEGELSAFDFFCIVVWKANRAKSKVAKSLLEHGSDLDAVVRELTRGLAKQPGAKDRLRYLIEDWQFHLPMASTVLAILYPDEFTIYDVRVCDTLGRFHNLVNRTKFENLWVGYEAFKRTVEESAPESLSLRDKDRYLWGKSFHAQLVNDIARGFKPKTDKPNLLDKYLELPTDELEWEFG